MEKEVEKLIDGGLVHYYDIELSNDPNTEEYDAEAITNLSDENREFHKNIIKDCSSWVGPCPSKDCAERHRQFKDATWLKHRVKIDDFDYFKDMYDFHVIAHLLHNERKNTFLAIRECKFCHNLQLYGSGSSLAILMSSLDTDLINRGLLDTGVDMEGEDLPAVNPLGDDIMVTDMDGNPIEGDITIEGLEGSQPTEVKDQ